MKAVSYALVKLNDLCMLLKSVLSAKNTKFMKVSALALET